MSLHQSVQSIQPEERKLFAAVAAAAAVGDDELSDGRVRSCVTISSGAAAARR